MRKTLLTIFVILALCLVLVSCKDVDTTKQAKTIEIKSVSDLVAINDYLGDKYSLYKFVLKNDLDLADTDWIPIGYDNKNSFRGTFDGNGKTIANLSIIGYDSNKAEFVKEIPYKYVGLFGYTYDATIKDLTIKDFEISFFAEHDDTHIGGLIGYAYGDSTIEKINIDGVINTGTTYHYVQKKVLARVCNQTQYIGGIFGYSSGKMILKNASATVEIDNLVAARGPKIDYATDRLVYIKDQKGNDTKTPEMELCFDKHDLTDSLHFPLQAFAGSIGGLVRGRNSVFDNIVGNSVVDSFYSRSAYLGGLFGIVYNSKLTNTEYSGQLQTYISIKGVSGGIASLIDQTVLTDSKVDQSTIKLNRVSGQFESYTVGGLVGYANDFSIINDNEVTDTKILSNLSNKGNNNETLNYPVIGGFAGTVRHSVVSNCEAVGGGVFKTDLSDINEDYIFSAGMVADVYGNSIIEECRSSFKAYTGTVAKYSSTTYIEENGKQVLRFVKENVPSVYLDVNAYVDAGTLIVEFINDAQEILVTYEYNDFIGTNIEEYSKNYYDEENKCLIDNKGKIIKIDSRNMTNYIRLTGDYHFDNLYYQSNTVLNSGNNDVDNGDGWYKFQLAE